MKRNLPAYIIRVLVSLYTKHYVGAGVMSDYFQALHGVKQSCVLSPVLFCIHIDNSLVALSKAGVGCFIDNNFVGTLTHADDIVLLAPSATALRKMLHICDKNASDYSNVFNAQKSKR